MTVSDLLSDARVAHVRELKAEIARLKAELAETQAALAEWTAHFPMALLAARDADGLPPGGRQWVIDGWNVAFAKAPAGVAFPSDPKARKHLLVERVRTWAARQAPDRTWLVFDGHDEHAAESDNLRISYTGGTGRHRADRLITDYVRFARLTSHAARLVVVTSDDAFAKDVTRLGAETCSAADFWQRLTDSSR